MTKKHTTLGDDVRANVGKHASTMLGIWNELDMSSEFPNLSNFGNNWSHGGQEKGIIHGNDSGS